MRDCELALSDHCIQHALQPISFLPTDFFNFSEIESKNLRDSNSLLVFSIVYNLTFDCLTFTVQIIKYIT